MRKAGLLFSAAAVIVFVFGTVCAQTTEFTYQGSLRDGASNANGSYDFEFALFDTVSGGAQLGSTQTQNGVVVSNSIFTVKLDFGSQFPGASRFLDIRIRPTGGGTFTPLIPRQQINSSPYSVKSLNTDTAATASNALNLGGVAANQFVVTTDSRMTDSRTPTAGSGNYIQNQNAGTQSTSNFNISGNGTAGGTLNGNVVNSALQFNIAGNRVLSVPGDNNLFAGRGAGTANVVGQSNSYFGSNAGLNNDAFHNSFFGSSAGRQTTSGLGNSFFGSSAGEQNINGEQNSFFGYLAGSSNTTGFYNAFFASKAGDANTTGGQNAFFGYLSGAANTTADQNAFYGSQSGRNTTTGNSNTFVGAFAGNDNLTGSENAFFGKNSGSNNLVSQNSFFGALSGRLNTTGVQNSFFGYRSGDTNSTGSENTFFGHQAGFLNTSGDTNTFVGRSAGYANQTSGGNSFFGERAGFANTGGANSFFGASAGFANTSGILNAFFGFSTGDLNTTGSSNSFFGMDAGAGNSTGMQNVFVGTFAGNTNTSGDNNTVIGYNADVTSGNLQYATVIGAGAIASASNQIVLGRNSGSEVVAIPGNMFINNSGGAITALSVGGRGTFFGDLSTTGKFAVSNLGAAGSVDICRNNLQELSTCSSSLRYKDDVKPFFGGLDVVRRLRPLTFRWKNGGLQDVGFGAEEVAVIEPLLATRNEQGEIEGVKYKQITTVLVNAVKEQQIQIEAQQKLIESQQTQNALQAKQIAEIKTLLCGLLSDASICKEQK